MPTGEGRRLFMNWFDWLIITVFILTHLWTVRRFSGYSPGSGTLPAGKPEHDSDHADPEVEAIQGVMVRLAGENQQWERRYTKLEADYTAAMTANRDLTEKLERRTRALTACRELLNSKQGVEDSGEILP